MANNKFLLEAGALDTSVSSVEFHEYEGLNRLYVPQVETVQRLGAGYAMPHQIYDFSPVYPAVVYKLTNEPQTEIAKFNALIGDRKYWRVELENYQVDHVSFAAVSTSFMAVIGHSTFTSQKYWEVTAELSIIVNKNNPFDP